MDWRRSHVLDPAVQPPPWSITMAGNGPTPDFGVYTSIRRVCPPAVPYWTFSCIVAFTGGGQAPAPCPPPPPKPPLPPVPPREYRRPSLNERAPADPANRTAPSRNTTTLEAMTVPNLLWMLMC